jgi:hypothetical protein
MNPFSRFLRQWSEDENVHRLLEHCDALEALVVRVYKAGEASAADEAEYQAIRRWLHANYGKWEPRLRPHWQRARVAGKNAGEDPILELLAHESAASFVGDWEAMQRLPAAREALNQMLLDE